MNSYSTAKDKVTFLLIWIGISILGWFLAPLNTLSPLLRTYLDVANRTLAYTAYGLIIGLIIGTGQSLLLKQELSSSKKWFTLTLAGYTLALPIGLAISTLIPAITFPLHGLSFLPLKEPSTISYFPFPTDIFFGGWIVGLAQWSALRQIFPYRNSRLAALWILGVWLGIGLGIFAMLIGRTAPINLNSGMLFDTTLAVERIKIGAASGMVSGLLLLFVIHQAQQIEKSADALIQVSRIDLS